MYILSLLMSLLLQYKRLLAFHHFRHKSEIELSRHYVDSNMNKMMYSYVHVGILVLFVENGSYTAILMTTQVQTDTFFNV